MLLIPLGHLIAGASAIYGVVSCAAVWLPLRSGGFDAKNSPGVTVLKPLCGVEPETYECLRSFCDQDYPDFQIVFGVADQTDPVVSVVQRLQREYPANDLRLVVDRRQHGCSRKVSNLMNMMRVAAHDYVLLADSDVRVKRDYIRRVVAPLHEPDVGIVTCPYRGISRYGRWSFLGSMFINDWFMPSVQVAARGGSRAFAFGATIGLRRDALVKMGGFNAIVDHLADDYRLGELSRGLGLRTVLSDVVVEIAVVERSFRELADHELRWLRTIRALRPASYFFCFVTFGVPVVFIGALMSGGGPWIFGCVASTLCARLLLHLRSRQVDSPIACILLIPLRDFLSLGLWAWSFMTRRVRWRDQNFEICRDGSVLPVVRN